MRAHALLAVVASILLAGNGPASDPASGDGGSRLGPLGAADAANWLPLRTPELTPGVVRPRALKAKFQRAVFVVGSDDDSLAWVRINRGHLRKLNAMGLLIDAGTESDLQRVADAAAGLEVLPVSGSVLAQTLGLEHYPLLIHGHQITQ